MSNELNYKEILNLAAYAVKNNDLAGALKLCKSVVAKSTPDQRLNLIHAAILNQLGMYSEAISIYKMVVKEDNGNELAKFQLGVAYYFSNSFDEAENIWQGLDDFSGFIYGLISIKSGDFEEAIGSFNSFISTNVKYTDLNLDAQSLVYSLREKLSSISKQKDSNDSVSESLPNSKEAAMEIKPQGKNEKIKVKHDVTALLSIYKDK